MDIEAARDMPQKDLLEPGPTLRVLRAAVDTLMDGAPPELAVRLAEDLPDPLKTATRAYNAEAPVSVSDFLTRFQARGGLPGDDLLHRAQIAIHLIGDMLPADTFEDLRMSFPERFDVLFQHRTPTLS